MISTYNAVAVVVPSAADVELTRRAAALLTILQPRKTSELAVHELLEQLGKEKLERESSGLNHWDKHAPQFLSRIVLQARREKRRRHQEAEAFFKAKHREAVAFALVIVRDAAAAEAVVSETYRELLVGSATIPGFFAALVCNARNYLESAALRCDKFMPLDEAFTPGFSGTDMPDGDEEGPSFEPISMRHEDQDPLDILIAREEESQQLQMVAKAKEDPRWRYIKLREWAAPLLENVRN